MEVPVSEQTMIFLLCILSGVIIGMFFDLFRIIRRIKKQGAVATFIEDLLFWIITTLFFFIYSIRINNGSIRFYMLCGALIGGLTYNVTISRFFIKISVMMIKLIKNAVFALFKIMLFPVRIIVKIFRRPVFIVIRFSKAKFKSVSEKIRFNIKWFYKLSKRKGQTQ